MSILKFTAICLILTPHILATNYFIPEWQQFCNKDKAEFHAPIHLHDILYSYAKFNKKSIIIQNLENPILNLDIQQTNWKALIEQLSKNYDFYLDETQTIWQAKPQNKLILLQSATYIKTDKLDNLKKHLKITCPNCTLTKTDDNILISSPKIWEKTIKKTLNNLNKPSKNIHLSTTIIQIDKNFISSWGKKWKNTQLYSLINSIPLPTSQFALSKNILKNQAINNLLSSIQANNFGKIIANAELTTTNKEPTQIESGIIVPYNIKDSRNRSQIIFKPVSLKVQLTPTIQNTHINLQININYNKLDKNNNDIIHTQSISTRSNLKNHQTLIISSLNKSTHAKTNEKNILSFIPIIGQALQHKETTDNNQLLLIFISANF